MLNKIVIKKLFGLYDYSIDWKDSSIKNLLFITGPNGMGKTTILRMISMLSSFSPEFYERIKFQEVTFEFDGGQMLKLHRSENSPKQDIKTDLPSPKTILLKCEFRSSGSVLSSELCGWEYVDHKLQKVYGEEMTNMRLFLQTESCRFLQDVRIFSDFDGEYVQYYCLATNISGTTRYVSVTSEQQFEIDKTWSRNAESWAFTRNCIRRFFLCLL